MCAGIARTCAVCSQVNEPSVEFCSACGGRLKVERCSVCRLPARGADSCPANRVLRLTLIQGYRTHAWFAFMSHTFAAGKRGETPRAQQDADVPVQTLVRLLPDLPVLRGIISYLYHNPYTIFSFILRNSHRVLHTMLCNYHIYTFLIHTQATQDDSASF